MAFDYTEEGNLWTIDKIRGLNAYFNMAVIYLSQFSESISLPQGEGVLEISEPVIYPMIMLLDDPYPIIQCRKRIFSGQKRIEISYGIFVILGMMGAFEKTIMAFVSDGTQQKETSPENIWKADVSNLVRCIQDALKYLERSYNAYPEEVPEIPPLTLSTGLLNDALEFIVGHELSHYLDPYYNFDYRNNQQMDVLDKCSELLKGLKRTPYKEYVNEFLDSLDNAFDQGEQHYPQVWSEEVLADFDGYHYLCTRAPAGYSGMRKIMAMSLSFMAMRIVEYFESTLVSNAPEGFIVPIRWRAVFLQYMIYKSYGSKYEYFNEFTSNEWGVYTIIDMLFERALIQVSSENKLAKKEDRGTEESDDGISERKSLCEELLRKMAAASDSEAEEVFKEIDEIYKKNKFDQELHRTFPVKKMAQILCDFGHTFYAAKQYEESYKWFYRGSDYFEASEELPGLPEAECYEYLGIICCDKGDYGNAVGWYNEALLIRQKVLGISFKDNAKIYFRIASALIEDGQEDSAEEILKAIADSAEEDNMKAEVFRKLGVISDNRGDYEAALEWFMYALDIKLTLFGAESIDAAMLYNSIGAILSSMEKFDVAEVYLMESLKIKKNMAEADVMSLANTMFNLGTLELRRGCYPKSLEWLREVLEMRLANLGDDHPLVADTLQSIGGVYYFQKDYAKALDYSKQALDIFRRKLGRSHRKTRNVERNIQIMESQS